VLRGLTLAAPAPGHRKARGRAQPAWLTHTTTMPKGFAGWQAAHLSGQAGRREHDDHAGLDDASLHTAHRHRANAADLVHILQADDSKVQVEASVQTMELPRLLIGSRSMPPEVRSPVQPS
jgi:hypothetical protein